MQSLRTRRPSDTRSVKRQPSKLEKKPTIRKNIRKSTVDDKIKERMSLRYTMEISYYVTVLYLYQFTMRICTYCHEASVPDVPSVPIGLRPGAMRDLDEIVLESANVRQDPKAIDQRLLDKEDFDPDTYLKAKPANSTEAELKSLQFSLRSSKDDTAVELQRDVFENYVEFVLISKEISVLENELLELKGLSEWKSMPSLLHIDESASASERRCNVRSSIADLRVLYANQMQTLHTPIEGSAGFVPTTPGRHVIYEMDGIFALNAATYEIKEKEEQRRGGRLVAERYWPLNEMLVLDTKNSASLTNVFKVRHQRETRVYRTEAPSDKKTLLAQFRQVAEELAVRKRKEREGEHERRKSMWTGGDRNSMTFHLDEMPPLPDWMAELARSAGIDGDTSARDKSERDGRFVSDLSDDLTVAIALRSWERAVDLVEEGRAKVTSIPSLSTRLTPLTASPTSALLDALSAPNRHYQRVDVGGILQRSDPD
ncbi:hypothetical protein M405DRAFT_938947 [Rhizopogon salebrosus TDB-379]|nr:hypothetical protein M405DRAFT_938947 [Rhizopogon salebrosus TDB-379]